MSVLQMWLVVLIGWLDRQEREALACLVEENRILRARLGARRVRLTNDERRRLAQPFPRTFCTFPREFPSFREMERAAWESAVFPDTVLSVTFAKNGRRQF